MKLYELKLPAKVICECSDGSRGITVHHIDGSYSYCTTDNGNVVHLYACTELDEMTDGSWEFAKSEVMTFNDSVVLEPPNMDERDT